MRRRMRLREAAAVAASGPAGAAGAAGVAGGSDAEASSDALDGTPAHRMADSRHRQHADSSQDAPPRSRLSVRPRRRRRRRRAASSQRSAAASTNTELTEMCVRSTQCALHLLHELDGYQGLRLHIGIGAGDCLLLNVGGLVNRWEFVVAGPPLKQMGIAEGAAGGGEVCVSPQVHDLAGRWCHSEPAAGG
ncbi:MAG: hypothetical protein ACK4GD_12900, partial [Sphingomonadaceae bacterium]